MFENYPTINYPVSQNGKTQVVAIKDISVNVKMQKDLIEASAPFRSLIIRDGETPEILSSKLYDNPNFHHTILIANDSYDWREITPLTAAEMDDYLNEAYVNPNNVHHWEDAGEHEITPTDGGEFVHPITYQEQENRINENKRNIQVIRPEYIDNINSSLNSLITK